jgi:hypothetical protein
MSSNYNAIPYDHIVGNVFSKQFGSINYQEIEKRFVNYIQNVFDCTMYLIDNTTEIMYNLTDIRIELVRLIINKQNETIPPKLFKVLIDENMFMEFSQNFVLLKEIRTVEIPITANFRKRTLFDWLFGQNKLKSLIMLFLTKLVTQMWIKTTITFDKILEGFYDKSVNTMHKSVENTVNGVVKRIPIVNRFFGHNNTNKLSYGLQLGRMFSEFGVLFGSISDIGYYIKELVGVTKHGNNFNDNSIFFSDSFSSNFLYPVIVILTTLFSKFEKGFLFVDIPIQVMKNFVMNLDMIHVIHKIVNDNDIKKKIKIFLIKHCSKLLELSVIFV